MCKREHQEHEVYHQRYRDEGVLLHLVDGFLAHELEGRGDIVQRAYQQDVYHHIRRAGGDALAVDDVVIKVAVHREQPRHDEEAHQREVYGPAVESIAEVARYPYYHLAEGEHHIEHDPLAEVREVHRHPAAEAPADGQAHGQADDEGDGRESRAGSAEYRYGNGYEDGFAYQQADIEYDMPALIIGQVGAFAEHKIVLHGEVEQYQRPRDVVLDIVVPPQRRGALTHVVHQIHIDEQAYVLGRAVGAVAVDEQGGEVPYLEDDEGGGKICYVHVQRKEAVLQIMQQMVVASDDIHEDEVVYQLDILDLFFFL